VAINAEDKSLQLQLIRQWRKRETPIFVELPHASISAKTPNGPNRTHECDCAMSSCLFVNRVCRPFEAGYASLNARLDERGNVHRAA